MQVIFKAKLFYDDIKFDFNYVLISSFVIIDVENTNINSLILYTPGSEANLSSNLRFPK